MGDQEQAQRAGDRGSGSGAADHGRSPAAAAEGTGFTLLVPATSVHGADSPIDWADALDRAEEGVEALRDAGLEVIETIVGDADFAAAAGDVLHSREIDDVVVLVDPEAAIGARSRPRHRLGAEPNGRFLGAKFRDRDSAGVILFSQKAP